MKNDLFNFKEHHNLLERIEKKKAILDESRPLSTSILNKLRENLAYEWTFHSNGIEGNTLSLIETKLVLENGITIGGKTLREHFEVLNHHKAIGYLESLVAQNVPIRAIDILKLHELVLQNIDQEFAGRIRNGMVRIIGANFTPPAPNKVSDLIDELIIEINTNPKKLSTPVLATYLHHKLVWIHPFFDGNGRTARLIMNLLLMKAGYPPCIILQTDRKKYYAALNDANENNYSKIVLLILQGLERSLNRYIETLPGQYEDFEPISTLVEEQSLPYSMEYISLLARKGKINAQKEGKTWFTTAEEIKRYAEKQNL
jgi:Fic family protein